ncbi:MAG: mannose-1-phosphate guanylyltransferase/mannose-6-phosphate isomerase [Coriobacteriia bacterium]
MAEAAAGDRRVPDLDAVILAGGSGARFWPLSRELTPKQLLSVFGGETLILKAVRRIAPLTGSGHVFVATGERLVDDLRAHLASRPETAGLDIGYLVEPVARNTAPAAALAAAFLAARDPRAIMAMLPSDHLLDDGPEWEATIRAAAALARDGYLVTVGLRPTSPETGYGYIRTGEPIAGQAAGGVIGCRAAAFVEKPDRASAERFLAAGDHLWNSGILVAGAARFLEELESAGEDGRRIVSVAREIAAEPPEMWRESAARERFASLPSVSVDVAVLEVSDRVAVVPSSMDWSDVGSLLAVERLGTPDAGGNTLVGRAVDVDSSGCLVYSPDRLVATLGLRDAIVVDTLDATLVADRSRAQDVRLVVEALKAAGHAEAVSSRTAARPWGEWTLLMKLDGFQVKSISVDPGRRLSLQSHARRSEHWVVVEGEALVRRGTEDLTVRANESVHIPVGTLHRLENPGPGPLRVIEVAVGDYLEEDDIVRHEDDWGREGGDR